MKPYINSFTPKCKYCDTHSKIILSSEFRKLQFKIENNYTPTATRFYGIVQCTKCDKLRWHVKVSKAINPDEDAGVHLGEKTSDGGHHSK